MSEIIKERPDTARVLAGLKAFQRKSVDYVFERLYGPGYTRRFLLADEVGLGKTLVARGVIAKAIDHLWDRVDRLDVVYICSNQDIARQNINRLNITGRDDFALASRITLLPIVESGHLRQQRINFVSFTPGTSFDLKSSLGIAEERVLLYYLLKEVWDLKGTRPLNVLQGDAKTSFRYKIDRFQDWYTLDQHMSEAFRREAAKARELRQQFETLCDEFHRSDANVSNEARARRGKLVGDLRALLARTCLQSLEPDLIILDEFQRFKHLLSKESEAGELAHDLFQYSDDHSEARVLLLSATPYKMYTMGHELAEDDHYADFLNTLRFLLHEPQDTARVEHLLKDYRRLLYRLADSDDTVELRRIRDELQDRLRKVICRTDRLAVTSDRSGMLKEIPTRARLEAADVSSYLSLQRVARAVDHHDTLEYWKSAPYLLSFMEQYALKNALKDNLHSPSLYEAIRAAGPSDGIALPWAKILAYQQIDARNPRLRALAEQTVETGAWRALWMPPCLSYYHLAGPVGELEQKGFTKRLVFSSWKVVPKAVATMLSYEAERRIMTAHDPAAENTPEARKTQRALLNFTRSQGRLRGMPVLGMLYPSFYLADRCDPMRVMAQQPGGDRLTAEEIVGLAHASLTEEISELTAAAPTTGQVDEAWYWAVPILLDLNHDRARASAWWADENLAEEWSHFDVDDAEEEDDEAADDESGSGWDRHVQEARKLAEGKFELGRPPEDLVRVVAELAIGGPAVCALRALTRVSGGNEMLREHDRRLNAGRVAWALRSLFNSPDAMALLRSMNPAEPYWRRVIEYCVDGGLQAVLDEYAHVLRESVGDAGADQAKVAADVAVAIADALSLRVANLGVDHVSLDHAEQAVSIENNRLRARFAMRFGDEKSEDGATTVSRADQVRKAFNSPFWPFVLATTSIGQEGLDFHTYCHAIMHWNLPANPVDLEQREGRIHRYKGHAVRRNIALHYGDRLVGTATEDAWATLFDLAAADHAEASAGLVPYWVFSPPGGVAIERHVPALPLSAEAEHLPNLRRSLAVYRMVFGQPRQDDLISYLSRTLGRERINDELEEVGISLRPDQPWRPGEETADNPDVSEELPTG